MNYCELCEDLLCDNEIAGGGDDYGHKVICHNCFAKVEDEAENGKPEPLSGMYLVICKNSITHQHIEYDQISARTLQEALDNGGMNVYSGRRRDKIISFKSRPVVTAHDVTMGGVYGCE